jgi:hypothetical protein
MCADTVYTITETRHTLMYPSPITSDDLSPGVRIGGSELGERCAPRGPRPHKILVVEDVRFNQDLLVQLLEDDYEVCTASDRLSAHAMRGDEAKALQSGCDAYLSKPFDEHLPFAILARFLGE